MRHSTRSPPVADRRSCLSIVCDFVAYARSCQVPYGAPRCDATSPCDAEPSLLGWNAQQIIYSPLFRSLSPSCTPPCIRATRCGRDSCAICRGIGSV
jgi:hypothetical protein